MVTWHRDTVRCFPCRSATSKITSIVHPKRQRAPHPLPSRICQYLRQLNPITVATDMPATRTNPITRLRADLPTEYNPVAGIVLPPERPCRWYRTTTYADNNRANMHTIHRPTDRRALRLTTITTRRSHHLLPSLQICHVENHVNSAP